jgi:hypothetical protein
MNKAGKKPVRLLFGAACLLLVSSCDLSGGGFVATPLPEPVVAPSPAAPAPSDDTTFDNVATFDPCSAANAATCTSDAEVSGAGIAKAAAAVDARIGQLQTGITVTVTGNADRRCTPAKSAACAQGKYLKAGSGGASSQNEGWSAGRSRTVTEDLQKELKNNPGKYPNYTALRARGENVTWNRISAGETYARYSDTTCRKANNSCADDRASDIVVSGACGATVCTTTPTTGTTTPTTGTTTPTTGATTPTPSTSPTTPATTPPPTTLPPRPNESVQYVPTRAFQNAQQNTDQRIVIKAATLVCAGCQQPPSSTSGVLYGWSATPDSSKVSFTLTPPSGYATPRDYRITSNPNGKSALSDQTAVMRFYTATRSGAPYRYTVTSTINYTMRLWRLEGTTLTYVSQESLSQQNTRSCSPSSCSFGVLGSNVG